MGTTLTPAPQSSSQHLHMVLSGAHLFGSRLPAGRGLPSTWSLTIGQGYVSVRQKKSQSNGRNLHFEHVCFCVVEPEIPYLLTESLIFFFFFLSLLLHFVGLGEIRLF